MENYEIDKSIANYMLSYMNVDVSKNIIKIFNTLNNINSLTDLDKTIDLSYIESIIVSIITTEDEIVGNMNFNIRKTIIDNVYDYLQELGMIINRSEITYSQLADLLESIYTLHTLDSDNMNYIISTFDINQNELNSNIILTLCNILSEYTKMSTLELYEIIEDVSSDILVNLISYFKIRIEEITKELNKAIEVPLKKLLNVENIISETYYYKDIMLNGYVENDLDSNIDMLYNNIEKHGENTAMVAPEILITLYLSTDTREDIMVSFNNRIDLTLTEHNNDSRIAIIKELLSGYVSKLKSGV